MRYMKSVVVAVFLTACGHFIAYGNTKLKSSVIEHAKRAVVSLDVQAALTAYTAPGKLHGNGVVIDKKIGYILTSATTVGPAIVADYTVGFFNGVEAKAKVVYYDPWLDYAILKVDPLVLPKEIQAIKLSSKEPLLGQSIFTIGKKKNTPAVVYAGTIDATNCSVQWTMPQHFIRVSMPSKTHAVGSLIFNEAGEGIALNCAGSDTANIGLHLGYVRQALAALKQNKLPVRKHIGALLVTYSIDDAIRYDHLSQASQKVYTAKFPNAENKILQVDSILKGTPAAGKLLPGDLIWALNGQLIGPNLIDFDIALDKSPKDSVLLTVFRNGSFHEVAIPCYNLHNHRITKMVQFGGATFFETDDFCSTLGGVSPKTLAACIAETNTIFKVPASHQNYFNILGMQFLAINGKPVQTLDALITLIPELVHQKYFTVSYVNHLVPLNHGMWSSYAHSSYKVNVAYDSNLVLPKVWTWDSMQLEWKGEAIVLQ
ncbi:Trypsin-like peptidase domain/PDZ domain protein [Cardinium endosymbiont of Sogatella furcifera]|uniref:trypsin-like peptidase domain-containing protein n=1 Tax=Cardinium endosymbiont of Sogatella furcifera TaxID=650378 RepID=UPI000E0D0D1C|nr:trypsin-like peptidase domain-containing protein [Cardinium endosymbiont of Sogatella furcifera]AXI24306.1 Trypsin-like peptidase domain/PDZ domain protein [Cardinium endosymbiont of Sogatella furcifera]